MDPRCVPLTPHIGVFNPLKAIFEWPGPARSFQKECSLSLLFWAGGFQLIQQEALRTMQSLHKTHIYTSSARRLVLRHLENSTMKTKSCICSSCRSKYSLPQAHTFPESCMIKYRRRVVADPPLLYFDVFNEVSQVNMVLKSLELVFAFWHRLSVSQATLLGAYGC